jgi:hypothetical protein
MEHGQLLLVEMGLLSFIAVAQCAPAILLGLYWRRGNRKGAYAGISAGFFVWFYTLIIPALGKEEVLGVAFLENGPFGLSLLRPTAFLGLEGLDTISHGVFWSFFFNVGLFVMVSLLTEQDADDRAQAAAFVGVAVEDKPAPGAPAILSAPEIERLVHHYVGDEDAEAIVRELFGAKAPADLSVPELLEMRIRFERLLAASLGAAAARSSSRTTSRYPRGRPSSSSPPSSACSNPCASPRRRSSGASGSSPRWSRASTTASLPRTPPAGS